MSTIWKGKNPFLYHSRRWHFRIAPIFLFVCLLLFVVGPEFCSNQIACLNRFKILMIHICTGYFQWATNHSKVCIVQSLGTTWKQTIKNGKHNHFITSIHIKRSGKEIWMKEKEKQKTFAMCDKCTSIKSCMTNG